MTKALGFAFFEQTAVQERVPFCRVSRGKDKPGYHMEVRLYVLGTGALRAFQPQIPLFPWWLPGQGKV